MITISGVKNDEERALIKEFTSFVLTHFVTPAKLKKADIKIRAINSADLPPEDQAEFEEASAWMSYDGIVKGRKKFTIELSKCAIKKAEKLRPRMREFLMFLSHELVHVKQYLNGELFDYANGIESRFQGKVYKVSQSSKMDWSYYESPFEIEAYGRAEGIYNMFCGYKWE